MLADLLYRYHESSMIDVIIRTINVYTIIPQKWGIKIYYITLLAPYKSLKNFLSSYFAKLSVEFLKHGIFQERVHIYASLRVREKLEKTWAIWLYFRFQINWKLHDLNPSSILRAASRGSKFRLRQKSCPPLFHIPAIGIEIIMSFTDLSDEILSNEIRLQDHKTF